MKVLIADDHWMIRASLKQAISSIDNTLQIVDASSFDEATNMLAEHHDIDLMLIDLVMPGFSDLDGLRRLRSSYPDVPVAVISVHEDRDHVLRAISEGVIAYIPKSAEGAELLRALSLILNGGVYFPRDILQGNSFRSQLPDSRPAASETAEPSVALTSREEQIFLLLGEGRSTSAVAKELGLSPNTVRVHLRNMNLKLNIKTRDELRSFLAARRQATKQIPG